MKASLAPQTRTSIMALLMLVGLAAGCESHEHNPREAEEQTPSASATSPSEQPGTDQPADISPLVGTWERTQRCAELVKVLTDNGLRGSILPTLAGDGWIPGVTRAEQIADPGHPCKDAVSRKHSHFFTADGKFGSLDADGQQVDDGRYTLRGTDKVVIGGVTFNYRIAGNDTIRFTPRIPACRPDCWEATWSVAVAYPGYTWHRVG